MIIPLKNANLVLFLKWEFKRTIFNSLQQIDTKMLSKNNTKLIKSLTDIKNRRKTGLFVAEGDKTVNELLLSGLTIKYIFATSKWFEANQRYKNLSCLVSQEELEKISLQKTPNQVMAIAQLPDNSLNINDLSNQLCLVLDSIQDPGNMGTIIRICRWFGIDNIICSQNTVDAYNPKVVQSSMGGVFRTKIYYTDLLEFMKEYRSTYQFPICGAFLEGESIFNIKLGKNGLFVLGNESMGISDKLAGVIDQKLTIPSYPPGQKNMESLNVAVAGAIILSEYRKRSID